MKLFYNEYKEDKKWPQLVANLPWGHNILLMEKIKDILEKLPTEDELNLHIDLIE